MGSEQLLQKLRDNLISQQERLLQQIDDLAEVHDDMEPSEYEETKADTLEQIIDVAARLKKLDEGDMTLTDNIESQKQLTRDAISQAFRTPEVIRMFAKREPDQLKQRLKEKERDFKLGKLAAESFQQDQKELLIALRQLGEVLSPEQERLLQEDKTDGLSHFERVSESTDVSSALAWAKKGGVASK